MEQNSNSRYYNMKTARKPPFDPLLSVIEEGESVLEDELKFS